MNKECDLCKEKDSLTERYRVENKLGDYCESCIERWDHHVNSKISEAKDARAMGEE